MSRPASSVSAPRTPRLDLTAPVRAGALAVAALLAVAGGMFAIDVPQGPVTPAVTVRRAEPVVVRHDMGGTIAVLHVAVGTDVAAGALIADLDRRHIESELAALGKRIEARRLDIDGLRQEAAALAAASAAQTTRSRIASLEAEMADADRIIVGHGARIALLEGQLDRLQIRAPVAGRVTEIAVAGAGTQLAAKAAVAVIRPSRDRLQLDVTLPQTAGAAPSVGHAARLWPAGSFGFAGAITGRIESLGGDAGEQSLANTPVRVTLDVAGTPLADQPGGDLRLDVQFVTGTTSLAQHFLAPLLRRRSSPTATEGATR